MLDPLGIVEQGAELLIKRLEDIAQPVDLGLRLAAVRYLVHSEMSCRVPPYLWKHN